MSARRFVCIAVPIWVGLMLNFVGLRAGEIHDAATVGDLDKVRTLLKADPQLLESKDQDGETPLLKACVGVPDNITQATTASFIIEQGANVNASGLAGRTPLMCVNKRQDDCIELMERLIARGADVNACMSYTSRRWTVFCGAAKSGNIAAARLLIRHGADINVRDIEGTPLQMAINSNRPISGDFAEDRRRNEAMAVLLVESGATLREFSSGNTELHLAAVRGFADLVRALVKRGADVNAVNDHGHTPLYYAARHGHRLAAEALLAARADQSAITESNFGKAPQLAGPLRDGEAWLWYLAPHVSPNTGYAIKTKNNLLLFDPAWSGRSPEAGLANGCLNPAELSGQTVTVLFGHPSYGANIAAWKKQLPEATIVLGFNPTLGGDHGRDVTPYRLAVPHESLRVGELQVHPIPAASRLFGKEGLGYLVEVDGLKIFHAGLHAASGDPGELAAYRREVDYLKRYGPIDIAILPISGRHLTVSYEPYLYLIDELSPEAIYLIGEELVTEEHNTCLEVLRARNVPVFYPEGGIAIGERFHFLRERRSARPAPDSSATDKPSSPFVCDYLNETPPGDEPEIFARGVVSVEGKNTHALAFSPDGRMLIFSRYPDRTSFVMVRGEEGWSQPERTSFTGKEVTFSSDGKRLFYYDRGDLFSVRLAPNGFSAPIGLGAEVNTSEVEYYPCITARRNLFFSRNSSWNEGRILVALPEGDGFGEPVDLGDVVNEGGASHGFVAPDERYLLFNSPRAGSTTKNDIWVSFRGPDGAWQAPTNLGPRINRDAMAVLCPTVSPDGKYLFFTRFQEGGTGLVYWVSTASLSVLGVHHEPSALSAP